MSNSGASETELASFEREARRLVLSGEPLDIRFNKEFDPGSGRTLAARLTHASRTGNEELAFHF